MGASLSMADDRYARAPGTSSMANGGRNIRARIRGHRPLQALPRGMALVSVCIAAVLALPALGHPAGGFLGSRRWDDALDFQTAMASARVARCTTAAAGAGRLWKGGPGSNGIYRALCAPGDTPPWPPRWRPPPGPDHWVYPLGERPARLSPIRGRAHFSTI